MVRYLFVYGTLKRFYPHPMSQWLSSVSTWEGKAKIKGKLMHNGLYPALIEGKSDKWINGELVLLNNYSSFYQLDEYEGDEYRRRVEAVTKENGEIVLANIYFWCTSQEGLFEAGSEWKG